MKRRQVPFNQKIAFSILEAAATSGLSKATLYNLIRDGLLPSSKVHKRRLILRKDLEDLILGFRQLEKRQGEL